MTKRVRKLVLGLPALLAVVLWATAVPAAQNGTYKGEIMDSACAAAGSHAGMMKGNPNMTAKDCTLACVQHGAKFVLYDDGTKTVYQLSDQKKPEAFAGQKVTVTGKLDDATKTIALRTIKAS